MKITKSIVINRPVADVWQILGPEFDQAHLWMGPIPHSYAIGEKKSGGGMPMEGRICHLSDNLNFAKAKEVLLQYSDAEKSLTFEVTSINVPAVVPIKRNVVQMSAQAIGAKSTRVIWVARPEPKLLAYPLYPLLRFGGSIAFGKLLGGLKTYCEALPKQAKQVA